MKKSLIAVALGALIAGPALAATQDENAGNHDWEREWRVTAHKESDTKGGITIGIDQREIQAVDLEDLTKAHAPGNFYIQVENGIKYKKDLVITGELQEIASIKHTNSLLDGNPSFLVTKVGFHGDTTVTHTAGDPAKEIYNANSTGSVDIYNWNNKIGDNSNKADNNPVRMYITDYQVNGNSVKYDAMPGGKYQGDVKVKFTAKWVADTPAS